MKRKNLRLPDTLASEIKDASAREEVSEHALMLVALGYFFGHVDAVRGEAADLRTDFRRLEELVLRRGLRP